MTPSQVEAIRSVIGLLAEREYQALANLTGSKRLTVEELRYAVARYGKTLVMPPGGLPSDIDEIPDNLDPSISHFVMSLWTAEEGQSDLSIELTLTKKPQGLIETQIDDIRVL